MPFVETKNHIKNQVMLALSIEKGTLIDLETSGIPGKDLEHEITCLGYITSNNLVILVRKSQNKELFYREIRPIVKKLPKPFYGFKVDFEKKVIERELEIILKEDELIDLQQPYKIKANSLGLKWPKLDELISEPEKYFGDMQVRGKDCPGLWKGYLATGNENLLKMIMQHNLSDLLRETMLMLLHPELYKR
jgi:uncharacterized protein YprB with RNaseH-like and TPR domain